MDTKLNARASYNGDARYKYNSVLFSFFILGDADEVSRIIWLKGLGEMRANFKYLALKNGFIRESSHLKRRIISF